MKHKYWEVINMNSMPETIKISDQITAEVFIQKTPDNRFIVAIPEINWSAQFNQIDNNQIQFEHLQSSLNFHLFDGNTDELANEIIKIIKANQT
jgi:hypothetical protein